MALAEATSSAARITRTTSEVIAHPDLSLPRDSQNTFFHTFLTPLSLSIWAIVASELEPVPAAPKVASDRCGVYVIDRS